MSWYTEYDFKTMEKAKKKQKNIKKMFGYTPEIFKLSKEGVKPFYKIVQPKNLKKIRR